MKSVAEAAQASICLTCFLLEMVWNKEMLHWHEFQLCCGVHRRVQVHQDDLKLYDTHQRLV
jgi:hypothetical protein